MTAYVPSWQDPAWQHPAAPAAPGATPAAGAAAPGTPAAPPANAPGALGGQTNAGPPGMSPWSSWMYSGGVTPGGWQNTGGNDPNAWQGLGGANAPNQGFLQQFQGFLSGGANPTQVDPTSAGNIFNASQPYADQAYQQSMRELQPQMDQQNAQFDQQMVSQGIPVGSAAYDQAKQQLSMQQNDAQNQARAQAQTTGLAAQGQGFGQGLSQSQLANTLAGQLLNSNTSMYNQGLGGNASVENAMLGGNSSLMNALLGGNSNIAQQIIGGRATMGAANAQAGASSHNGQLNYQLGEDQLAQSGQQSDFNNLMSLLGMGSGVVGFNNNALGQDQQAGQSFFNYLPNGSGGQIDAQSPYNNYYNGSMNQWNYANNQANAENQAGESAAMLALLLCDREAKETVCTFRLKATEIIRKLPVDVWRYKGERDLHIGTYAQDFNEAAGLTPNKYINIVDMLGVLLKAQQEVIERLDRLEQKRAA